MHANNEVGRLVVLPAFISVHSRSFPAISLSAANGTAKSLGRGDRKARETRAQRECAEYRPRHEQKKFVRRGTSGGR